MIGPMLEFMKTGQLVTFLAVKIPFIDEDLVWGFHLNLGLDPFHVKFITIDFRVFYFVGFITLRN